MNRNRQIVRSVLVFLINHLARLDVTGLENLPSEGGYLLSANHCSRMDGAVLISLPIHPDTTALMADKYEKHWFFGWFGRTMEFIFIDRSKADFTALRNAIAFLKQGRPIAVSPEGTRSQDGSLLEGKPGIVLIASKANVPIIPAGVVGTREMLGKILTFRRPTIRIQVGKPMTIPPLDREKRDEQLQFWTDELMCRIAAFLPEEMRGFYKNNPRVQELIAHPPE